VTIRNWRTLRRVVAHRQTSPECRDWLAKLLGTRSLWQMTSRTARIRSAGSARRVREFRIFSDTFGALNRGQAGHKRGGWRRDRPDQSRASCSRALPSHPNHHSNRTACPSPSGCSRVADPIVVIDLSASAQGDRPPIRSNRPECGSAPRAQRHAMPATRSESILLCEARKSRR
jgi:hypothetical protein